MPLVMEMRSNAPPNAPVTCYTAVAMTIVRPPKLSTMLHRRREPLAHFIAMHSVAIHIGLMDLLMPTGHTGPINGSGDEGPVIRMFNARTVSTAPRVLNNPMGPCCCDTVARTRRIVRAADQKGCPPSSCPP